MQNVILHIEGMACNHCTSNVAANLSGLSGVEDVKVSLENKCAEVAFDQEKITPQALKDVVEELGFTVTEIEA